VADAIAFFARRQGTASTLTRAEVRGGGKKPYAQKGTGQARRGSKRSPLMVGGGVAFGPKVGFAPSPRATASWRHAAAGRSRGVAAAARTRAPCAHAASPTRGRRASSHACKRNMRRAAHVQTL
jgi:hypothetical protein